MSAKTVKRVVLVVAAGALVAGSLITRPASPPSLDLSTPGAIALAAVSGQLDGYLDLPAPTGSPSGTPKVTGEVTTKGFENQIAIDSASLGIKANVSVGPGGTGGGAAQFENLVLKKAIDKSSPVLFNMIARGKHSNNVTLSFATGGKKPVVVLTYEFDAFFPTKLSHDFNDAVQKGGPATEEILEVGYGSIAVTYYPQPAGSDPIRTCYDKVQNNEDCPIPQ